MTYLIAQPRYNFKMGIIEINSEFWYLVLHASNQPAPNDREFFVIYDNAGDWKIEDHDDVDMCQGVLCEDHELTFHDEVYDRLEDAIEALYELNYD